MTAYSEAYLDEVVENQGKLFEFVAENYPDRDTKDFIENYMKSNTRRYIDEAQAFVCTKDYQELWEYFCRVDGYQLKKGNSLTGFTPDWIGRFYAYFQWFYNIPSSEVIKKVPLDYLIKAYPGLHDLELDLAVKKVGENS